MQISDSTKLTDTIVSNLKSKETSPNAEDQMRSAWKKISQGIVEFFIEQDYNYIYKKSNSSGSSSTSLPLTGVGMSLSDAGNFFYTFNNASAYSPTKILCSIDEEQLTGVNRVSYKTLTATGIWTYNFNQNLLTSSSPSFSSINTNNIFMNATNAGIELGNVTASNTSFIDFHSSGNNIDYDSRIIASGGSSTVGAGTLNFIGSILANGNTVAHAGNIASGVWTYNFNQNLNTNSDVNFNRILSAKYSSTIDTGTPGKSKYNLHLRPIDTTQNNATGITFGADTSSGDDAQAGIYVQYGGAYGTKMYFATTDNYSLGSRTRMTIGADGLVGINTAPSTFNLSINRSIGLVGTQPFIQFNGSSTAFIQMDDTNKTNWLHYYNNNYGHIFSGIIKTNNNVYIQSTSSSWSEGIRIDSANNTWSGIRFTRGLLGYGSGMNTGNSAWAIGFAPDTGYGEAGSLTFYRWDRVNGTAGVAMYLSPTDTNILTVNGYVHAYYLYSSSGGAECNASSPPYVYGRNGSDYYLRTYATSSLSVGYATYAQTSHPSYNYRFDAPANGGSGGFVSSGNFGGTGTAAYFPSGLWSNGANAWIYGTVTFNGSVSGITSLTATNITGTLSGTATYAGGSDYSYRLWPYGTNPDGSHPGYGVRVFYSWNAGQAYNASSGYSNGITIGSHPSDQAYGFQLVQNMWDDNLYMRRYNSGWQSWQTVISTVNIGTYVPVGTIIIWPSNTIPSGWLECNGQAVSRTTYATLFALLRDANGANTYVWGSGDGSTTFNLPDLRAAAPVGSGVSTGYASDETVSIGSKYNDCFQGHKHYESNIYSPVMPGDYGYLSNQSPANNKTVQDRGYSTGYRNKTSNAIDSDYGTIRVNSFTKGKTVGVRYIIKY